MRPFFFGKANKPLFGMLHPPGKASRAHGAAVVCPPFGPEYVRAHRALRELARRLAADGLCTVRFDYYGTGDSSGREDEGSPEQWLDDIDAALLEAKEAGEGGGVCLVGLRLGAALAVLACLRRRDIERLVLWDPVVVGRSYHAELLQRHRALVAERPRPKGYHVPDLPTELLGSPVTPSVRAFFESLDLLTVEPLPVRRVCVVCSDANPSSERLAARLREQGSDVHLAHSPGHRVWLREDEFFRTLVPQATIDTIASWLSP